MHQASGITEAVVYRSGCAKAEGNIAVGLMQELRQCESCGTKQADHGLPAEHKKRWCAGCAETDGRGAVLLDQQRMLCEDCMLNRASYGLPSERHKRWCRGCANAVRAHRLPTLC